MVDKKVVVGSDITARQMKEFWRQVGLGKIDRSGFQLFLEFRDGLLTAEFKKHLKTNPQKFPFFVKDGLSFLKEEKPKELIKLELEEENFRADSSGWQQYTNEQGITYLDNPKKDISEYVAGVPDELIGQQLFTWGAAMRETEKAGKRIPTNKEWNFLEKDFLLKGCLFSGNRNTNGSFFSFGFFAYFWSSSVSGGCAWSRLLSPSYSTSVNRDVFNSTLGFSVRCLKD